MFAPTVISCLPWRGGGGSSLATLKATLKTSRSLHRGLHRLLSEGDPLIVGTLHEATGLRSVSSGKSASLVGIDVLEARLDHLLGSRLPATWPLPVIATARHPSEGGAGNLPLTIRRRLLVEALEWADGVDVELRSARSLAPVIAAAHQRGATVILSHHDFRTTPSLASLRALAMRAADQGADLFKVAVTLGNPSDLSRLIEFQRSVSPIPVATMGMGPAGRFSRLVLAGFGSPLCYGWLGKPQVPGQWPALGLRAMFDQVLPS